MAPTARSGIDARLDALSGALAELASYDNTNTNQIVLVDGVLDANRLRDAVERAARAFPLLSAAYPRRFRRSRQIRAPRPAFSVHKWEGSCDLADEAFRALLMALNEARRLDWKHGESFHVYLVVGDVNPSSCVYLSSAHAVADARSDSLLLERIVAEYACSDESKTASCPPAGTHGYEPLQSMRPEWYTVAARARRLGHAAVSIAVDLCRRDRQLRVGPARPRQSSSNPQIDFYHGVIEADLEADVRRIAKQCGVTLNTVFAAALVRLIQRHGVGRPPVRLTCAISLRYTLDARYRDTFRNYLVATGLRIGSPLSDRALVAAVHDAVRQARTDKRLELELGRLEWLEWMLRWPALYPLTQAVVRRAQGTNACYSNPGRIDLDMNGLTGKQDTHDQSGHARQRNRFVGFGCLVHPYDFIFYTPTVNGRVQFDSVFRRDAFSDFRAQFIEPYSAELAALIAGLDGTRVEAGPIVTGSLCETRSRRASASPRS